MKKDLKENLKVRPECEIIRKEFSNDDDMYYSDFQFITNSQLGLLQDPRRYFHYRNIVENNLERNVSPAMVFGDAFHTSILEPHKFEEKFIVEPNINKRTNAGKEEYQKWLDDNIGMTSLKVKDYDCVMNMRNKLLSDSYFKELLSGGTAEYVDVWEEQGVNCKGKYDYITMDKIIDIKTTSNTCEKDKFIDTAEKYGYFRQAAFYLDGAWSHNEKAPREFYFIVIEKTPPYLFNVFIVGEDSYYKGRTEYKKRIKNYKDYIIGDSEGNKKLWEAKSEHI
tara:strand:- start:2423 stop:3262 length:840 start_codon:yes stop_codon:yes gene_type:complete